MEIVKDSYKKKGRKKNITKLTQSTVISLNQLTHNIQYIIEESDKDKMQDNNPELNNSVITNENTDICCDSTVNQTASMNVIESDTDKQLNIIKKRGRKPKGGKIIVKTTDSNIKPLQISNIILHLKCSLSDLNDYNQHINQQITNPHQYDPTIPPSIMTYTDDKQTFFEYKNTEIENKPFLNYAYNESNHMLPSTDQLCAICNLKITEDNEPEETDITNIKVINQKLKKLKINLYKNTISDKKSACFWCTYDYDNPACYIPKYNTDERIFGYGSFCRPECAVAFLMNENIDDSTKFERYHLLNQIYSKIYNYKKNIKPAPDPHYLLDKFYGTLSIQEYRKLLKSEHLLLVIDKPLTRILPELHEDTEEFILNLYGNNKNTSTNTSGIYKVKKQSEKQQGPSKNSIMRNNFGL